MKLGILFAGIILMIFGVALLAADTGAELFQKAVTQEQAAGNLPEAIKLYQQVAKDYASDRPLAAKALVQAARCYEKLGEGQATKLYEQVARDFSDQVELANTARARLAALRQAAPATMTARRVDDSPIPGYLGGYGQRTILREGNTLYSADALGNNKRSIYTRPGEIVSSARFSFPRDLSLVLIDEGQVGGPHTIKLMKSDGTGQRDLGQASPSGPARFSWDNRYAVFAEAQKDGSSRIIKLGLADGRRQELLRREQAVIDTVVFSPDGRFIAFTEGSAGSNKVLVAAATGGEPVVVSEGSGLVDWTRDGRYLAINSGRPAARALYLLPIKDGRPAGAPVFIRNGAIESGGTLPSGALLYTTISPPGEPMTFIGSLAQDGHVEGWKPLDLESGIGTNPRPNWSPDGRQIVYIAASFDSNQPISTVRVHDVATGSDREIYRARNATCHFANLRPKIYCAVGNGVTTDFIEIAPDTGVAEKLASVDGLWVMHEVSPDDSEFYGYNFPKGLERWNRGTGQATPMGEGIYPSPDGKWIWKGGRPAEPQSDPALQLSLDIRPASDPAWRHVGNFRMTPWQRPGPVHVQITPDGQWLYFHARDAAGKDALFRVPTAGGEPVRLGDVPSHAIEGYLRFTRDGRKILLVAPDATTRRSETWLLENFEPKQPAAK